jgi:hypothetical protein
MTQLIKIGVVSLIWTLGMSTQPAIAGFFDDIKNTTQNIVGDVSNDVNELVTDKSHNSEAAENEAKGDGKKVASSDASSSGGGGLVFTTEDGSPTFTARSLLLVHFRPDVLDDDAWLKKIAGDVEPSRRNWINSDEFRWRKEKSAIKAKLLNQAKNVPTSYIITPWPGHKVMADLGQYDFDRKAFKMRVHIGSSGAWPWGGDNRVEWLPVSPDIAEQMVTAFNNNSRLVYTGYTLHVASVVAKGSGRNLYPFFDDRIDKIDIYTLKGNPFPTSRKDFQYRVSLDTRSFRMIDHAGRR